MYIMFCHACAVSASCNNGTKYANELTCIPRKMKARLLTNIAAQWIPNVDSFIDYLVGVR